jgi:hypothetical protein
MATLVDLLGCYLKNQNEIVDLHFDEIDGLHWEHIDLREALTMITREARVAASMLGFEGRIVIRMPLAATHLAISETLTFATIEEHLSKMEPPSILFLLIGRPIEPDFPHEKTEISPKDLGYADDDSVAIYRRIAKDESVQDVWVQIVHLVP